jgi:HAD superfamily hydrolase (TIGR01549 family)
MYSSVLLDAGGVLLDESEYEKQTCQIIVNVLKKRNPEYTEQDYINDLNESIKVYSPHNRQYIIWKYCEDNQKKFEEYWSDFKLQWKRIEPPLKMMAGIIEEIKELKEKYKIILAGQYGKSIIELLKSAGISSLFENKLTQDDFRITKPDPRYLEQICLKSNVDPNKCIMIGDRIDKDIIPAKQNMMGTVLMKTGVYKNQKPRTNDEIPDLIVNEIQGLGERVKRKFA